MATPHNLFGCRKCRRDGGAAESLGEVLTITIIRYGPYPRSETDRLKGNGTNRRVQEKVQQRCVELNRHPSRRALDYPDQFRTVRRHHRHITTVITHEDERQAGINAIELLSQSWGHPLGGWCSAGPRCVSSRGILDFCRSGQRSRSAEIHSLDLSALDTRLATDTSL